MAGFLSNLSNDFQFVPPQYVLPPEKRPQEVLPPAADKIPVIDLSKAAGTQDDRRTLVQQIIKAGHDFGIFQVINHGVPKDLMEDTMKLYKELFNMPYDEVKKYTSNRTPLNGTQNELQYWKDAIKHYLNDLEEQIKTWPSNPARYREVIAAYSRETLKVSSKILELISQGLGLDLGYFEGERSDNRLLIVNYYPPCPDPSLTLGLYTHSDVNLITILQQDVFGLQLLKDGEWVGVNVLPNSFVVNVGCQLQVISNDRLRSPDHRVVTNSQTSRTSACIFVAPTHECVIEPQKALLDGSNPRLYKSYKFEEFLRCYKRGATTAIALEPFKLRV